MSAVQAQKKPGGAGVKLFQAILVVNRDPGGTPVTLTGGEMYLFFYIKGSIMYFDIEYVNNLSVG